LTPAQPRIVLTSGEPAGIGPDLCIAIAEHSLPCKLVVVGDRRILGARARQLGRTLALVDYRAGIEEIDQPNTLTIAHIPAPNTVIPGKLDSGNASYVLAMLDFAVGGCMRGEFAAMVTAPVQKSVINDSGVAFSGHTEYLAERTSAARPVMMLVAQVQGRGPLRVALATTHLPISRVAAAITQESLMQTIRSVDRDLRSRFHIAAPRTLVCGLNPHAGESGHLGREEIEVIAPALAKLRAEGLDVIGPVPADTAFTPRLLKGCDVVLAMFHDQGLPVLKYAGFGEAINVTLGLPIVRTSVDHGTALDLAGSGKAEAGSLEAALRLAIELSSATPNAEHH
jgi:4-hydroxythreonine-4-phosphate dehydrogenase